MGSARVPMPPAETVTSIALRGATMKNEFAWPGFGGKRPKIIPLESLVGRRFALET